MTKKETQTPPNQELIEETLKLIDISSMDDDEKNMWTILLPSMEKEELEKFYKILEKEVKQLLDIYLEAKKLPKKK